MRRAVVTGAAGAQAGAIARAFQDAGYHVVGLSRTARPDRPGLARVDTEDADALARDGSAAAELGVAPEPMAAWAARQAWPGPGG